MSTNISRGSAEEGELQVNDVEVSCSVRKFDAPKADTAGIRKGSVRRTLVDARASFQPGVVRRQHSAIPTSPLVVRLVMQRWCQCALEGPPHRLRKAFTLPSTSLLQVRLQTVSSRHPHHPTGPCRRQWKISPRQKASPTLSPSSQTHHCQPSTFRDQARSSRRTWPPLFHHLQTTGPPVEFRTPLHPPTTEEELARIELLKELTETARTDSLVMKLREERWAREARKARKHKRRAMKAAKEVQDLKAKHRGLKQENQALKDSSILRRARQVGAFACRYGPQAIRNFLAVPGLLGRMRVERLWRRD